MNCFVRSPWTVAIALFVAVTLFLTPHASRIGAQDPNAKSNYGEKKLEAGFTPDPFEVKVEAGGNVEGNQGGFKQYVSKEPDFRLEYKAGENVALIFRAKCTADTALLVNLPDGSWLADDDSGGNLNPMIKIAQPKSGRYEIWVGTIEAGKTPPAVLSISEIK